jgi:cytochrome c5
MRKLFFLAIIIITTTIIFIGCQYKKDVVDYPVPTGVTCDTSNVKYSVEITAILNTNCYSCHASAVAAANASGVKLDSYNNLKTWVVNNYLLNVIMHTSGYNPMPASGGKLSDCDIAKIRTWIRNGYPNN